MISILEILSLANKKYQQILKIMGVYRKIYSLKIMIALILLVLSSHQQNNVFVNMPFLLKTQNLPQSKYTIKQVDLIGYKHTKFIFTQANLSEAIILNATSQTGFEGALFLKLSNLTGINKVDFQNVLMFNISQEVFYCAKAVANQKVIKISVFLNQSSGSLNAQLYQLCQNTNNQACRGEKINNMTQLKAYECLCKLKQAELMKIISGVTVSVGCGMFCITILYIIYTKTRKNCNRDDDNIVFQENVNPQINLNQNSNMTQNEPSHQNYIIPKQINIGLQEQKSNQNEQNSINLPKINPQVLQNQIQMLT